MLQIVPVALFLFDAKTMRLEREGECGPMISGGPVWRPDHGTGEGAGQASEGEVQDRFLHLVPLPSRGTASFEVLPPSIAVAQPGTHLPPVQGPRRDNPCMHVWLCLPVRVCLFFVPVCESGASQEDAIVPLVPVGAPCKAPVHNLDTCLRVLNTSMCVF